ncbi:MAG: RNA polymerase-binding protein DksA [Burkholderiaceae bacterium]|nr:RNA polymerase-binding protein DksA [Burkholderiaceae bacterium]
MKAVATVSTHKSAVAKAPAKKADVSAAKAVAPAKPSAGKAQAPKAAPSSTTIRNKVTPIAVAQFAPPKNLPMPFVAVAPVQVVVKKDLTLANNWKIKPFEEWSDDEVIAMPDDEYMNEQQLAFFRLKLVNLKNGILASAGQTAEHLRDDTTVVPDPADRATIEEEHALELRTRDRERKLLKKIEQSIARIDSGDYGYCDETGEAIGVPRLLARPTATLSLEAQQRRELKQKMFGD